MALGFGVAAASADIWIAAACCVVGGVGNGAAVVCNALLVQRGAPRRRARPRVHRRDERDVRDCSASRSASPARSCQPVGARWVWASRRRPTALAAVVGYVARARAGDRPARRSSRPR